MISRYNKSIFFCKVLFIYNMITLHNILKWHKERNKMWDTVSAFKRFVIEGISSEEVTFE